MCSHSSDSSNPPARPATEHLITSVLEDDRLLRATASDLFSTADVGGTGFLSVEIAIPLLRRVTGHSGSLIRELVGQCGSQDGQLELEGFTRLFWLVATCVMESRFAGSVEVEHGWQLILEERPEVAADTPASPAPTLPPEAAPAGSKLPQPLKPINVLGGLIAASSVAAGTTLLLRLASSTQRCIS